jgi:DMSO/TMAO reductase YedYZ molybdopterin-dependent catalytic subunit
LEIQELIMRSQIFRLVCCAGLLAAAAGLPQARAHFLTDSSQQAQAPAGTPAAAADLKINGAVDRPVQFTLAELQKMPRTTVKVVNRRTGKTTVYEGVALVELLRRAGTTQFGNLRDSAMARYVAAEGSDGYRAVFSIAEVDPGMTGSEIMVADTMDDLPLATNQGPLRIVAPHDRRPARWVRRLQSITVVRLGA